VSESGVEPAGRHHGEVEPTTREPATRGPEAPATLALAREFFAEALSREPEAPVVIVVPAPLVDPVHALRRLRKQDAWLLSRAASGHEPAEAVLGLGRAVACTLEGQHRLAQLGDELARDPALTRLVHARAHPPLAERLPLRMVGLAFAAGASAEEPWREHGDGRVVTPRWTYLREGEHAVLAWTSGERWRGQGAVALGELEALFGAFAARPVRAARPRVVSEERATVAAWEAHVREAVGAIERGELRKVVAARRTVVATAQDLVAEDVLASLPESGATRFLVRIGASAFVGATPERLFRKRGRHVTTEALAGTRASATEGAERGLLASEKDHSEHSPVLAAIVSALEAVGARVRTEPSPRIKRVANLVHLRTAIHGELERDVDAATLLAQLHPTPAVGGTPRAEALDWIGRHEVPRGWYAGPLGWVDARGDAELLVALRSALVRGGRAWIYAGGGIVASSDPRAEYVETELKMTPLLRAVGAEPHVPDRVERSS
jgi:isochorismate synthase